ncbi:unnamed protein product [Orchesella dallaii]|uniref:Uncharacterized protein n=1 Tax=Orchesella dallaii TaxID=48710 RepID=A0ABP1PU55_9HEXA
MKTIHILVFEVFLFSLCIPAGYMHYVKSFLTRDLIKGQSNRSQSSDVRFADEECESTSSFQYANYTGSPGLHEECQIDMNVMQELVGLILAARDLVTGAGLSSRAEISADDDCSQASNFQYRLTGNTLEMSEECEELVLNMKALLKNITMEIEGLLEWVIEDPGEYPGIIGGLQDRVRELNRRICDLKTEHDEELQKEKEKLNKQKDCFILLLNEKEKIIDGLKLSLDDERLKGMVSKLQAGLVPNAISDFLRMNNDSIIVPLIKNAYGPEYLEHIGLFAKILPHIHQRMMVYNTTYLEMGSNNHFITANIIILLKILKDEQDKSAPGFNEIFDNCITFSNTMLASWGNNIRSRNAERIQPMLDFGSPPTLTFAGRVFTETLPQILEVAYANQPNNAEALLEFTQRLRWNAQKYTAVTNLTAAFTKQEDKLRMAFKAKEIIANLDGPDGTSAEWEDLYEDVYKRSLDSNIRMVVWHTRCTLANPNGNFLTTSSRYEDFVNTQVTMTTTPSVASWWIIENFVEDNKYFFQIKSEYNKEYLGAHLSYEVDWSLNGKVVTSKSYGIDKRFNVWRISYEGAYSHEVLFRHEGRPGNLESTIINLRSSSNERSMYITLGCE